MKEYSSSGLELELNPNAAENLAFALLNAPAANDVYSHLLFMPLCSFALANAFASCSALLELTYFKSLNFSAPLPILNLSYSPSLTMTICLSSTTSFFEDRFAKSSIEKNKSLSGIFFTYGQLLPAGHICQFINNNIILLHFHRRLSQCSNWLHDLPN